MGDDEGDGWIGPPGSPPPAPARRPPDPARVPTGRRAPRGASPRPPSPPRRRAPVRATRLVLALALIVALSVILVESGPIARYSTAPPPAGGARTATYVWDEASYDGPLAGGVNESVEIVVPAVPSATASVYVDGSFQMRAWTLLSHGLFQSGGNCASGFGAIGACSVYVGIWNPANWTAYLDGGAMHPLWCYPGNVSVCQNVSAGGFATPNLSLFDGSPWEIVVWNLATYSLSGDYQFTVYTSGPSS